MLFRSYVPRPPLSAFVVDFWTYEGYGGPQSHERILPSGTFELVINLREDELRIYDSTPGAPRRFEGAVLSGPYPGSFSSDVAEEAALVGVHFRVGGAYAVLGIPAGEFTGMHVGLGTLWGAAGRDLRERLCAERDATARFYILERALLERMSSSRVRHPAVRGGIERLVRARGQERIRDAARALGLSQRRFTDLFLAEVGLTPKVFARVQRFQQAVVAASSLDAADWALAAVEGGYFDQSHLIHEFTEFSGMSPAEFRRRYLQLRQAGVHVKRHHLPLFG